MNYKLLEFEIELLVIGIFQTIHRLDIHKLRNFQLSDFKNIWNCLDNKASFTKLL